MPADSMPPRSIARTAVVGLACLRALTTSGPTSGQSVEIDTGPLYAGYTQLLMLASTPELMAGEYHVRRGDDALRIRLVHLPHSVNLVDGDTRVSAEPGIGYLRARQQISFSADDAIRSEWSVLGLGVGLRAHRDLGPDWAAFGQIRPGLAYFWNESSASGPFSTVVVNELRGTAFNWETSAVTAIGSAGVERRFEAAAWNGRLKGQVMHGWIKSLADEALLAFEATSSVAVLEIGGSRPATSRLFGRSFEWRLRSAHFQNFGSNRRALGYDRITQISGGIAVPVETIRRSLAVTMTLGAGNAVRSLSIGLSIE